MRKLSRRVIALMLAAMMTLSMVACGSGDGTTTGTTGTDVTGTSTTGTEGTTGSDETELSYDEISALVYDEVLGEFYEAYMEAKEATNVSERFALMAVAEAKLMESALMLPLYALGGNYAIGRLAPYSTNYCLWGLDSDRVYKAIVTTEPITTEDRNEMKAKWSELRGTGTYEQWAKDYLVSKGYTLKDSYSVTNNADPNTWDVFATSLGSDSEKLVQTFDCLLEYDIEGIQQPALAESYTVSDDGLVYTFKIREGVTWVDSQGRYVADLTADDFVAGMQHMMDAMGGLEYLIKGIIVNAEAYIYGDITDFSQVGVKALDDYTLEYTLEAPCSYFTTMLGYSVFAPLCRSYYESQGGKFGLEFDDSADTYTYGKSPDNIAYCGAFLVTNATEKNAIIFKQNESYWNVDAMNITSYSMLWNDGSEATKAYNDMKAGTIDAAGLNSSSLELAKNDGWFDKYNYVVSTDTTSYMGFYNVYRTAFANSNDETVAVSTQTEEEAERTNAAMMNVHFRRAISFAADRATYNAQSVGEELKLVSLRNSYTPGTYVQLEEEVTIDINGTATTYPAGTMYGQIMQDQIDADGVVLTVWDPDADEGLGSSDGFDGWYNPEAAAAEMATAIEELAAQGVEISAENPIYIDLPYFQGSTSRTNMVNAYKQSLETVLEGKVIVNLVACTDDMDWYYAGYFTSYGYEANYDMYDLSGWMPDYGDPSSYLDTFLPEYEGYMVRCIGIY